MTKIESAARPLWNRLNRLDTFKKLSNSVYSFTFCNHEIILVLVIPFKVVAVLEQVLPYLCSKGYFNTELRTLNFLSFRTEKTVHIEKLRNLVIVLAPSRVFLLVLSF